MWQLMDLVSPLPNASASVLHHSGLGMADEALTLARWRTKSSYMPAPRLCPLLSRILSYQRGRMILFSDRKDRICKICGQTDNKMSIQDLKAPTLAILFQCDNYRGCNGERALGFPD